eukprot:TRINITY_DN2731_c0_g1_i5.p1 TRINITY_DN2731_c0_g1~~TRINITY_DN2731_c0_g1_i5.p1  ORF type:complete len:378 (-),score=82.85 TRINITY_DN2731_c0_g1_i5:687-1820(-)
MRRAISSGQIRSMCKSGGATVRVQQLQALEAADFKSLGVGGHHELLAELQRRVFASRTLPPEMFDTLGIRHVKGVLLHGPPGTGKTLLARNVAKLLSARPPKLVNGPEIFRSWVGESENNIRDLFKAAQTDFRRLKERSPLHVIIFDEIDAICRARGGGAGGDSSNAAVFDSVVSQVLTMLDGLSSSSNVLVIGITNRPELLDPALLRPGRLEVHLEVGLPTEPERLEILELHCAKLQGSGYLTADLPSAAVLTEHFTGAEIESVVLDATSRALAHAREASGGDTAAIEAHFAVSAEHLTAAIAACEPVHGKETSWLERSPECFPRSSPLECVLYCSVCVCVTAPGVQLLRVSKDWANKALPACLLHMKLGVALRLR